MEHITDILKKQQELEFLKEQCQACQIDDLNPPVSTFCDNIFSVLHQAQKKQTQDRILKLLTRLFISIALLTPLVVLCIFSFSNTSEPTEEISTLVTMTQDEIDKDNYDKARKLLEESFKEYPDSFAGTMTYFNLYEAEKNYDQAAWTLIHYITDIYGIQNVTDSMIPYATLKDFSRPLSEEMQSKYDACIQECQKSAGRFHSVQTLIETGNFKEALILCDSLKSQHVSDSVLIDYYCKCYTSLEEYEACADYLIEYGTDLQRKGDQTEYKSQHANISYYIKQIYHKVSHETQKKLDSFI